MKTKSKHSDLGNIESRASHNALRRVAVGVMVLCGLSILQSFNLSIFEPSSAAPRRRQSDQRITLLHSDELYHNAAINRDAQILVGHVRFRHEGVIMTCDSALYYEASNSFDAFGHVRMNQADTLTLSSDVLFYDGADQMARARYNVVMTHRKSKLYCDSMDYDRLYDLGYFFNGGRLVDEDNTLTSYWGQYKPSTREAIFNYNVELKNPHFTLISDTLHYNTGTGFARIVGPSNIDTDDSTHIWSANGTYDTRSNHAHLLERSVVTNKGATITADSLDYIGEGAVSKGFGNVVYTDIVNRNMFRGNYCLYADSVGYAEAADSALMIDFSQRDTFYVHADTFKLFTYDIDTDSMWREMRAYRRVRAFRIDVQAVCDSMVFISRDSCLTLYRDPILWQHGQQLVGEEIRAWMNDSTLDSTYVMRQALSVDRVDSLYYNQVAGNEMRSYFGPDGKMEHTVVDGNVLVNYYPFDEDSLMIGMNHLETTQLKMFTDSGRVSRLWAAGGEGTLYPLSFTPPNGRLLSNFAWFDYIRPVSPEDVFIWRGKKEGSELKKSVRHDAPKQKLGDRGEKPKKEGRFNAEQ